LIHYYSSGSLAVSGATVQLRDMSSGGGTAAAAISTGLDGQFAFSGFGQGNWEVQPQKTGDLGFAVDINDAVMVLKATVGAVTLSPRQQLAADVSGDGSVDINDAVLILRYTVGAITRFPVAQTCNSDWAFVPEPDPVANQQIVAPQIGVTACQPNGAINFRPLTTQATNQNFSAVLFGDCDGSWRPSGSAAALAVTSEATAELSVQRGGRRGQLLRVPVTLNTAGAHGLSVDLRYDPTQMTAMGVRPVGSSGQTLMQTNLGAPGLARVALLSTAPMPRGAAFVLELALKHNRAVTTSVHIQRAVVAQ
jgi:hypothetical protein